MPGRKGSSKLSQKTFKKYQKPAWNQFAAEIILPKALKTQAFKIKFHRQLIPKERHCTLALSTDFSEGKGMSVILQLPLEQKNLIFTYQESCEATERQAERAEVSLSLRYRRI